MSLHRHVIHQRLNLIYTHIPLGRYNGVKKRSTRTTISGKGLQLNAKATATRFGKQNPTTADKTVSSPPDRNPTQSPAAITPVQRHGNYPPLSPPAPQRIIPLRKSQPTPSSSALLFNISDATPHYVRTYTCPPQSTTQQTCHLSSLCHLWVRRNLHTATI